jgi:hypothetical protein
MVLLTAWVVVANFHYPVEAIWINSSQKVLSYLVFQSVCTIKSVDIIFSAESLTTWRMIPSWTNSPPEEVSSQWQ